VAEAISSSGPPQVFRYNPAIQMVIEAIVRNSLLVPCDSELGGNVLDALDTIRVELLGISFMIAVNSENADSARRVASDNVLTKIAYTPVR
jgi:hypothetical protein